MVHRHSLLRVTEFLSPASGGLEPSTLVSFEQEFRAYQAREDYLRAALEREKVLLGKSQELIRNRELLRKEAEHRLLNGLQMIVSLLLMQSRAEADAGASAQLADAAARVGVIARVHCRLHALNDASTVEFKSFLADLCREYESLRDAGGHPDPSIMVEGDEACLSASTAVPLSLIANELITNAAKHGRGTITVRLEAPAVGAHRLSVCNDGPPLPRNFDCRGSAGLGMKIVSALVEQIGGRLQFDEGVDRPAIRVAVTFH